ncbi:MAG: hypothetical protein JSR54_01880 [Proteobacteria bacterium]|nr:hypothetical protein [Pseudomonadota bacterium]
MTLEAGPHELFTTPARATDVAGLVALAHGAALYALYAGLRPGLLAERFAAAGAALRAASLPPERLAQGLAGLAARRAQALDPLYQALEGAVTVLFCGLVLGAYLAFQAQVAARLGRGPRPAPRT